MFLMEGVIFHSQHHPSVLLFSTIQPLNLCTSLVKGNITCRMNIVLRPSSLQYRENYPCSAGNAIVSGHDWLRVLIKLINFRLTCVTSDHGVISYQPFQHWVGPRGTGHRYWVFFHTSFIHLNDQFVMECSGVMLSTENSQNWIESPFDLKCLTCRSRKSTWTLIRRTIVSSAPDNYWLSGDYV